MKTMAQIFLSYARKDEKQVEDLYQKLSAAGLKPWMDKKDILPGEIWESCIQRAIRDSDFFLACLSAKSVKKRGFLQKEIRDALNIWQEKLEDDIYLIPVRLDDCEVPESLRDFQWVNLFEGDGWARLMKAIQVGMERREEGPEKVRIPEVIERTLVLEIPGLEGIDAEIYLASDNTYWEADLGWKYHEGERPGTYILKASMEMGLSFKHFVVSEIEDRRKVAAALRKAGYRVTGTGDESLEEVDKWRMWFLLRKADGFGMEGSGVWANNVWS